MKLSKRNKIITYVTGDQNIKGTHSTKYHNTNNRREQIIETDYFELRTPENWIHIFGGHGVEGDPYG